MAIVAPRYNHPLPVTHLTPPKKNHQDKLTTFTLLTDKHTKAEALSMTSLRLAIARLNLSPVAVQGMTAMHLAAGEGHLNSLQLLVDRYGFDVNQPSEPAGWRPLHLCCAQTDRQRALSCLNYLLSVGADPSLYVFELILFLVSLLHIIVVLNAVSF